MKNKDNGFQLPTKYKSKTEIIECMKTKENGSNYLNTNKVIHQLLG